MLQKIIKSNYWSICRKPWFEKVGFFYAGRESLKVKGHTSYGPADMLKLFVYGYLNKIRSGRNLTVNDLFEYKNSIVSYLKDVLNNIDEYISNKNYYCI